jgi:iron complex transport system ATP-binding protein
MPALSLVDVRAGYGRADVVEHVTLSVEPGEVVALVGRNGAGKTTCLRVAGGILRPRGGRVLVGDVDLATLSPRAAARRIAGVPQEDVSDFAFTVREVAALGRAARLSPWRGEGPDDAAAVDEALRVVGLEGDADRLVTSLSGGERRRVSLARCLAQDAEVLLLDEPTAHLDLGHETRLVETLGVLARERGKAVLAAVHDLSLAAVHADRVVLLAGGRVAAEGTPREVLTAARVKEAFGADVHVLAHPDTGAPVVVPGAPQRRARS